MFKSNVIIKWLLIAAMTLLFTPAWAAGKGTISGQAVDTSGAPIAGVLVSTDGALSVTTNPGGLYTLTGVKQKARILVNFAKSGYVASQGTASLVIGATNVNNTGADEGGIKVLKTSLNKALLKSGTRQSLNTATGATLNQGGFKASFAANSLTVKGNVDITISPVSGSSSQIKAAPGNFTATTASGMSVKLKSYAMVDVSLSQNGLPVNLKPGATAGIELLLPANTALAVGVSKSMWYFDTAKGLWQEEGTGIVKASTTAGRKAVFATVKHFTDWAYGEPASVIAIVGRVVGSNGIPSPGASLFANAMDESSASSATTDDYGNYCIEVATGSAENITAWGTVRDANGLIISGTTTSLSFTSYAPPSSCATGATQVVPDLVLQMSLSCISGIVQDASGLPVEGVTVYSTSGVYATSQTGGVIPNLLPKGGVARALAQATVIGTPGAFQLFAPSNQPLTIYADGYFPVTVTTSADGSCVPVVMQPLSAGACITGNVQSDAGNVDLIARVVDASGNIISSATVPAGATTYCINALPGNSLTNKIDLLLTGAGYSSIAEPILTTGPVGGTCISNSCNVGPNLIFQLPN